MVPTATAGACSLMGKVGNLRLGDRVGPDPKQVSHQRMIANFRAAAGEKLARDMAPLARWYALVVVAGHERRVAEEMERHGIDVRNFTEPQQRHAKRGGGCAGRSRTIQVPAFPGYLFVRCVTSDQAWHGLFSFAGVVAVIESDGRPAVISDEVMQDLQRRIGKKGVGSSTGSQKFHARDKVEVLTGIAQWHQGVVASNYAGSALVPVKLGGANSKFIGMYALDEIQKIE